MRCEVLSGQGTIATTIFLVVTASEVTSEPRCLSPRYKGREFAISRPIVLIACMLSSSESWELQQHPRLWHSRAGGGGRGRDEDLSSPPAQIPAGAANAPGSHLG